MATATGIIVLLRRARFHSSYPRSWSRWLEGNGKACSLIVRFPLHPRLDRKITALLLPKRCNPILTHVIRIFERASAFGHCESKAAHLPDDWLTEVLLRERDDSALLPENGGYLVAR